ncbi:hypothetical protein SDC9_92931 [bioreactor metagenome]|uniref:Uncharacterized protein n=1 Tax=bioreactor metagenome TaxID=1076179 RepID=A0A645A5T7_9ZZZZ
MHINIKIEVHAYAEEKLCDECIDDAPFYGIIGPEIMLPLSKIRGQILTFEYDNQTTLNDLKNAIFFFVYGDTNVDDSLPISFSFLVGGERYYFGEDTAKLSFIVSKYLGTEHSGQIVVCLLVSCDAGDVATEWPLRFFVHSRESGSHNDAHIHVCDTGHQYEASIRISDGKVIAGKLPSKFERLAKKRILSDQDYFYDCWNKKTDGLKVDINHHYEYIQY